MKIFFKNNLTIKVLVLFGIILSNNSAVGQDAIENSTEIDEIIVTGSRIKGVNTDSFSPVGVVSQDDILLSGN